MALVKTKGLVLRERPFQEQDKMLTIFTEEEGKIQAIAKGVRRGKGGLLAATQLFSFSEFVYYPGKNFASINQADLIQSFYTLRSDLVKMSLASYVLEMLDAFYDLYQGNRAVLRLVNVILFYMAEGKSENDEALVAALQLKLCEVHGIRPVLSACTGCEARDLPLLRFSIENSGLLCDNCKIDQGYTYHIPPQMPNQMAALMVRPIKEIKTTKWPEADVRKIMDIMNHYIAYHLGKNLKTYDFYKEIKN